MANPFLIITPWITEKAARLASNRQYIFLVRPSATKSEIKKVVKQLYGADVEGVNMVSIPGRVRRFRGRAVNQPGHKKAIVTVKEGQTITLQ